MTVTAAYAKKNLSALLNAVASGQSVTISRYRKPVADLVPPHVRERAKPKFGTGKGIVKILDSNWSKAIETEQELTEFLEGWRPAEKRRVKPKAIEARG